MLVIQDVFKMAEKDNWENGCDPDSGYSTILNISFQANDQKALCEEIKEFFGEVEIDIDPCSDEPGRIDISVMENENAEPATEGELMKFKLGLLDLWYCTYTMSVMQMRPFALNKK